MSCVHGRRADTKSHDSHHPGDIGYWKLQVGIGTDDDSRLIIPLHVRNTVFVSVLMHDSIATLAIHDGARDIPTDPATHKLSLRVSSIEHNVRVVRHVIITLSSLAGERLSSQSRYNGILPLNYQPTI